MSFLTKNNLLNSLKIKNMLKVLLLTLIIVGKVTNYIATTVTPSSNQIFCSQNKKMWWLKKLSQLLNEYTDFQS